MALGVDASALLVYRAAWTKDVRRRPRDARGGDGQAARDRDRAARRSTTPSSSSAALGVTSGHPVERLYREIRALRIYEGASEVQQLIIARAVLRRDGHVRPRPPAAAEAWPDLLLLDYPSA